MVQVSPVEFRTVFMSRNSFQESQLGLKKNKVEGSFSDAQKVKSKMAILLNLHCYTCYSRLTK